MSNLNYFLVLFLLLVFSCKNDPITNDLVPSNQTNNLVKNANGFSIQEIETGLQRLLIFDLSNKNDTIFDSWLVDYTKFKGEMPNGHITTIPVLKFACRSTTHLAFFNFLDKLDLVNGLGYATYANNPKIKKLVSSGSIKNLTSSEEVDLEILASLSPQIFTTYPYGNLNENRINSFGITSMPILEYQENSPLKKAEWIKLFGVLVGQKEKSIEIYNSIAKEYNSICEDVNNIDETKNIPTVFTGSLASGRWAAPSGKSSIAQFIADAGAQYVFEDYKTEGNIELEYEEFYAKTFDADYWGKVVFENGNTTKESLLGGDDRLNNLDAVKSNNIFYCDATTTDYFGDAIMEPQVILQDLVNIFHDRDCQNNTYFKPITP